MIEFWHLRLLSVGTTSLLHDGRVEKSTVWKATWSNFGEYGFNEYSYSMQSLVWSGVEVFSHSLANEVHVINITIVERLLVANGDYIQDWVFFLVPLVLLRCKTEPLLSEDWTLLLELLELHLYFMRSSHLSMTGWRSQLIGDASVYSICWWMEVPVAIYCWYWSEVFVGLEVSLDFTNPNEFSPVIRRHSSVDIKIVFL